MTGPTAMFRGTLTGRKVLLLLFAFFGVIFAVNGAFVFFALHSWPGLTSHHAYEEGVHYNQTLDVAKQQEALGWNTDLAWDGRNLSVSLTNRAGEPLSGFEVAVKLVRPTSEGHDFTVKLEPREDSSYAAPVTFPLPGLWRAEVFAHDTHGTGILRIHELMVK